ncbi:MAG: 3-keto-5-aminohexanoate cleavage protein, partial [Pseudomonadota bacterium]
MSREKVIITIAPTGGLGSKEFNPALPTQPQEIADDVFKCYEAGASVVAVHARSKEDDTATCDETIYRDINTRIREKCDIIINNSTGGGPTGVMVEDIPGGDMAMVWTERMRGVEAGAEICTHDAVTAATYAFGQTIYMLTPLPKSRELAERMKENGIKPEWECFGPHNMLDPITLIKEGLDEPPYIFNFVLGVQNGIQGAMPFSLKTLQTMVEMLPKDSIFTVSGIGPAQLPAAMGALHEMGYLIIGLDGAAEVTLEDALAGTAGVPLALALG